MTAAVAEMAAGLQTSSPTLKAAKVACNVTTGNNEHKCDAGINVCTCATSSAKGPAADLKTSSAGGAAKALFSPKP